MTILDEAEASGCRQSLACKAMGIGEKTFKRWSVSPVDKRKGPVTVPSNKLTEEEREEILKVATSKEFVDLSPSQIVPKLADQSRYVASESSFYRVLNDASFLKHRGKSKKPNKTRPDALFATAPNQIYSWDITYLPSLVKGQFFYLYMFMDVFSRKVVGYEV